MKSKRKFFFSGVAAIFLLTATTRLVTAHASLLKSDPAPNSVVATAPKQVTLWFDEPVDAGFSSVQVLDQNRTRVDDALVSVPLDDQKQLRVPLKAMADGTYTVVWKALSAADGHVTRGIFAFSVGTVSTDGGVTSLGSENVQAPNESSPISVFTRWLDLFSLLALVGAISFREILLTRSLRVVDADETLADARWRQLAALALVFALIGESARLVLQASFATEAITIQTISQVLFDSRLGAVWIWRFSILALLGFLLFRLRPLPSALLSAAGFAILIILYYGGLGNEPSLESLAKIANAFSASWNTGGALHHLLILGSPFLIFFIAAAFSDDKIRRFVIAFLAISLLFTVSLTGHSAAQGDVSLAVIADGLHLLAVSFWVGGLVTLVWVITPTWRALPPEKRSAWLAWLIPQFSRVALVSVAVLFITGLYAALTQVPSLQALFQTLYGETLTIKVALFLVMLNLGAIHLLVTGQRFALTRAQTSATRLFQIFRALIGVEAGLGIVAIALAGFMTLIPPARSAILAPNPAPEMPGEPPLVLFSHPALDRGIVNPAPDLNVTLRMTTLGAVQTLDAFVTDANGKPAPNVLRVIFEFTLLDEEVGAARVNVDNNLEGHYITSVNYLALPGMWRVKVTVRRRGVEDVAAVFPFYAAGAQQNTANDPRALEMLKQADAQMNTLKSLRTIQDLNDGANGVVTTRYEYQAPDRMRFQVGGGGESIAIGGTQYYRDQDAWIARARPDPFVFPKFNNAGLVAGAKLGRAEALNGIPAQIVEVTLSSSAGDVHYAYWIGTEDRFIHQYAMVAPAHYMMEYYFDHNAPVRIEAPANAAPPATPAAAPAPMAAPAPAAARIPGLITGDLESDAGIAVFIIALGIGLRGLEKKRTVRARLASLAISLALIGTAIFLFADAVNAANNRFANVPIDEVKASSGKSVYEENCAACHGPTGYGNGPAAAMLKTRPFDLTVHAPLHDDAYFIAVISGGRGEMPAFKERLTSAQIIDVIAYMRLLAREAQAEK